MTLFWSVYNYKHATPNPLSFSRTNSDLLLHSPPTPHAATPKQLPSTAHDTQIAPIDIGKLVAPPPLPPSPALLCYFNLFAIRYH